MRIISDKTGKEYVSVEECLAAEKEYDEAIEAEKARKAALAEKRADRAKEVEAAYHKVVEAQKDYHKVLASFCKDYGAFHMTLNDPFDFFNLF